MSTFAPRNTILTISEKTDTNAPMTALNISQRPEIDPKKP